MRTITSFVIIICSHRASSWQQEAKENILFTIHYLEVGIRTAIESLPRVLSCPNQIQMNQNVYLIIIKQMHWTERDTFTVCARIYCALCDQKHICICTNLLCVFRWDCGATGNKPIINSNAKWWRTNFMCSLAALDTNAMVRRYMREHYFECTDESLNASSRFVRM